MFELFLAELRQTWILFRRYPAESIGQIVILTSVFYGLFLSTRYIAGPNFQLGDRLESIIIGYVLWTLVNFALSNIAARLQIEAQTGTLEQIFLSQYGAVKVFLMRALADLTLEMLKIFSILVFIILLTGSHISFPPMLILPFTTVVLGAYGFAFIIASSALLLKRVQQLLFLFQIPLLLLLIAPTETWTGLGQIVAQLLPMTTGASLLRDLMARGESLNFTKFVIAFVNGGVYFFLGLLFFRVAERKAKRRGILSGY
jgi:ABC-2 type transport system permease protein